MFLVKKLTSDDLRNVLIHAIKKYVNYQAKWILV